MTHIGTTHAAASTADIARTAIRWLVALVLVELVFLQHGRVSMPDGPSLRIPLFAIALGTTVAVAALLSPAGRREVFASLSHWLLCTVGLLGIAVPAWGGLVGLATGTSWRDVFGDANGHVFHLIAIPMVAALRPDDAGWLVRTLSRVVCVFCVGCLVVYVAAVSDPTASHTIEETLRTQHLGFLNEFTDGRPYRLWFKSYVFVLAALLVAGHRVMARRAAREDWVTLALTGLVLWNSYTRSIWLMAGLSLALLAILEHRRRAIAWLVPTLGAAVATPLVASPDALSRLRLDDRDGTIAVRLRQVTALVESWLARPITGAGFGTPIAAGGVSVELDLLNLLRKIGLVGAALYVAAFWAPLAHCRRALARSPGCPDHVAVFLAACMSVFGMGFFNPYATASLGVGLLAIGFATLSAGEAGAAPVPRSSERPEIRDEIPDLVGGERLEAGGPLG
jgi:hypothetical protein